MSKKEITNKIKTACKEYGEKEPDFNNYKSVRAVVRRLNNYCRFCKKYKGYGMDIICECEMSFNDDF